jgi:predicted  nucleic acid-binding Zn-ribbon protein
MEREVDTIRKDFERTTKAIENSDRRVRSLGEEIGQENSNLASSRDGRQDLQNKLDLLAKEKTSVGLKAKSNELAELENKHATLYDEVN